jgi:hypothetical protein
MIKFPFIYDDDGEPIALPYKWEICSQCSGEGRSSAYLGAFTWDELREQGDEFIEDYFAGNYDRACDCCGGSGKITVADYGKMTEDQVKAYEQKLQDDYEYESMRRAEMRMGC